MMHSAPNATATYIMLKLWLSLVVGVVVLLLQSSEDTMSQREGQTHVPPSPVHVGLEELTVQEAQTLSLELQYVAADDVLDADAEVHVASMRLYSQPC